MEKSLRLKQLLICLWCVLCLNLLSSASTQASVNWKIHKKINLENTPLDVVSSANGKWIFILSENNTILIYSNNGYLKDEIHIKGDISQIQAGPREDILLLTSKKNRSVQVLKLEFIQEIDTSGASFLGNSDAPVVITVFTDYQ